MRRLFLYLLPVLLLGHVGLSACSVVGLATGAGAGTAVAASEERGLGGTVADAALHTKINVALLDKDFRLFRRVSTSVHEGRVLLMGIVPNPEAMADAVRLAWQAEGTREVINELHVAPDEAFLDSVRDGWISTKIRTRIMFDKEIEAINYSIETVGRVIYILGIAQNREELDRVIRTARDIEYVEKIISHVILKDDPRRKTP